MSASQRTKGKAYELEVARALSQAWGCEVKRKLSQVRDGGDDLTVPGYRIECKRRAHIAVYDWMRQVIACAKEANEVPVVILRGDQEESLVLMRLPDWARLAGVKAHQKP